MAITAYVDMLPALRPHLPDCEDNLILQMLQLMGREFHLQTEAYEVIVEQDLVADQKLYTVAIPASYEIVRTRRVETFTDESIAAGLSDGVIRPADSYDLLLPDQLEFYPNALSTEAVTDGMKTRLVLAPTEDALAIDSDFLNRWSGVIKAGALMELFGMPNRMWSSEAARGRRSDEWKHGIAEGVRSQYTSHTSRGLTMKGRDWLGRTSGQSSSRRDKLFGGFYNS